MRILNPGSRDISQKLRQTEGGGMYKIWQRHSHSLSAGVIDFYITLYYTLTMG